MTAGSHAASPRPDAASDRAPSPGSATPAAVLHATAEYWPFARTGGLAEAVRGVATYQARAGREVHVVLPLYRIIRERFPDLIPWGDPLVVPGPDAEPGGVRILTPAEWTPGNPRVLFLEHDRYFDREAIYGVGSDYPDNHRRFAFFARAAVALLPHLGTGPRLLHPHDWHAALATLLLRTERADDPAFAHIPSVLTVHNAGYQGHFGPEVLPEIGLPWELFHMEALEWYGKVNILKGGLVFADMVTTVSPTHARELRTRAGGFGLHDSFAALQDRFVGITNGLDHAVWNPATDPAIEANFTADDLAGKARCKAAFQAHVGLDPDPEIPLFAMTARLVEQKGFDLLLGSEMIPRLPAQWAFLGEGEERYRAALADLAARFPGRVGCSFTFTEAQEHRLLAAADFLLMPSQYEPCGLTQMRAQRYGALPVVRRVGGLADTVEDRVTGFVFDEYQSWALEEAVGYAIALYRDREAWEERVRLAMARDFSWTLSVQAYDAVYQAAFRRRRGHGGSGVRSEWAPIEDAAPGGTSLGHAPAPDRPAGS